MKIRHDTVRISSVLLTVCLLSLIPNSLKDASTWKQSNVWVGDQFLRYNCESLLAFASLALIIIGIIVVWTSYQQKARAAWFIMVVFVDIYFLPVYSRDMYLEIKTVGLHWAWWTSLIRAAIEGRLSAKYYILMILTFAIMTIALILPMRAFFGGRRSLPTENKINSPTI